MSPPTLNPEEAVALERLAIQLEQQGYTVAPNDRAGGRSIDFLASTPTERLAITVTASACLRDARALLRRLRAAAARQGCSDYRLIVIDLPQEASVLIAGVAHQLFHYLLWHVPGSLLHLAPAPRIEAVQQCQIETMTVTRQHLEVRGTGVVAVSLRFDARRDTAPRQEAFPCWFHIFFDRRLRHPVVAAFELDIPG
jgi:hypothetical protein